MSKQFSCAVLSYFVSPKAMAHREIPLSKGMVALVSECDFELVSKYKWHASLESRGSKHYAITRIPDPSRPKKRVKRKRNGEDYHFLATPRQKVRMHRLIMGMPNGFEDERVVDHLLGYCAEGHFHDSDPLDNRRCGLEIVTQEENMRRAKRRQKKIVEPCL